MSDGNGGTATATVAVTVTAVNDPPLAVDDTLATSEDTAGSVNVVANDSDIDGGTLVVSAVGSAVNGTVSFSGGSVTYTPNADFNGSDAFGYTVSDGNGGTDTGVVTVSVAAVNDAPVADNDAYSVAEDAVLNIAAPGVLDGDSDVDSASLTAVLATGPASGVLNLNPNGSFSYTPNANFNGSDAFTYRASDGALSSVPATVSITVTAVNDAPVAVNDTLVTDEDTAGSVTVVANDSDADGDTLVVSAASNGANGSVSFSGGSVTYTPAANFSGSDAFGYTVSDGNGGTATATVAVTVTAVNDPPVLLPATFSVAENAANGTGVGSLVANDPDAGQTVGYAIVAGNTGGAFAIDAGTGAITVASSAQLDFETTPSFALTIRATDNGTPVQSGDAVATVNLTNVDEPPTATAQSLTTTEDTPLSLTLAGVDPEGAALAFTVTTPPTAGALSGTAPAQTYTPNADQNGADSFAFTVRDPGNQVSAPATVSITVLPVNDRPAFSNLGAQAYAAGSSGVRSVPGWAFAPVFGPANESSQAVLAYQAVEFSDPANVVASIAVANDGTLSYVLTGASGIASVDVTLRDNGGTANGGIDTSLPARLLIGVGIEADLGITKSNGVNVVEDQQLVTYTIVASNPGTAGVIGARVTDPMPPDLVNVSWSCVVAGGATCPASGLGDIDVLVDLPIGASATFTVTGRVQGASDDELSNTAFIVPPAAVFDPDLGDNEATDTDLAQLFADSFE